MRTKENLLKWSKIAKISEEAGIYGTTLKQVVTFLHEMGTLQHFNMLLLKDYVVINPQWIVDVMACVVSVHSKVIKVCIFSTSILYPQLQLLFDGWCLE